MYTYACDWKWYILPIVLVTTIAATASQVVAEISAREDMVAAKTTAMVRSVSAPTWVNALAMFTLTMRRADAAAAAVDEDDEAPIYGEQVWMKEGMKEGNWQLRAGTQKREETQLEK